MNIQGHLKSRRTVRRLLLRHIVLLPVWSTPALQAVTLPAHAQTSAVICGREQLVGDWDIELFGLAASIRPLTLHEDSSVDGFVNAWHFSAGQITMAQGLTWLLRGQFNGCDELRGTYVNTIIIPPLGNVVIRRGDWIGRRVL